VSGFLLLCDGDLLHVYRTMQCAERRIATTEDAKGNEWRIFTIIDGYITKCQIIKKGGSQ
jgi:hypothetical protein